MLAQVNPVALPALRVAGMFFLTINILAFVYFFRHRQQFFGKDPDVPGDIPAARKVRIELILIPWFALTLFLVVMLVVLWTE